LGLDDDLSSLIERSNHLGVLQLIRKQKLREPELVLKHGTLLLGKDVSFSKTAGTFRSTIDESQRLGALEQVCISALDVQNHSLAEEALAQIKHSVGKESVRYRRLLGLCLESSNDIDGAVAVYNFLLRENPSNVYALKRKYCILKSQIGKEEETREALNNYLEKNGSDVSAWAEMSKFCAENGDYAGAAYCYEEVVLANPLDAEAHCTLGEWYATTGGRENLKLARKHMAQSLELDPKNLRAMYGLVSVSETYLEIVGRKKNHESDDLEVAKELVKYGVKNLSKSYEGSFMKSLVETATKPQTSEQS